VWGKLWRTTGTSFSKLPPNPLGRIGIRRIFDKRGSIGLGELLRAPTRSLRTPRKL
jgi:hypothetical protein